MTTTGIDASDALKVWMDSPGHRKNILAPGWREVGLSALTVAAAPGVFGGRDVGHHHHRLRLQDVTSRGDTLSASAE